MKIFQNKIVLIAVLAVSCPAVLTAQQRDGKDSTFKSQSLDFYSTYKPEIAPAPKPVFTPTLPVVDTAKPRLQYVVPEQTISYSYKAEPIKPLALKRAKSESPFENYAKLGIGSQGTFLIDAGIGSLKGDNYDAVLHFNHFSQKGRNSNIEHQQWSQNTVDASGNIYLEKGTLQLGVQADRRAFRQYGYNNFLYTFEDDAIKNVYSGLMLNTGFTPVGSTFWDLKYKPDLRLYFWNNSMGASEQNLDFSVPVSKAIDSNFSVSIAANVGLTNYKLKGINNYANNYLQIAPALHINYEGIKAKVGIKPTFASTQNFVLPDIQVSGWLFENAIKLYGGWEGQLNQNSYRSLSLFNPYMQVDYVPIQGRVSHIYGGFETSLTSNISFGATVGYKMWKNLALFENNYAFSADGRKFKVLYEDMNALVIDAKFQYLINEKFMLNGRSEWNLYNTKKVGLRAQQLPQVAVNGGFKWNVIPKLWIGADLTMYDRIFAKQATGVYDKLSAIVDLSANASYDVHKRFSLFLNVDNILNQRYQYWNQYRTIGFAIYGGLRFKF